MKNIIVVLLTSLVLFQGTQAMMPDTPAFHEAEEEYRRASAAFLAADAACLNADAALQNVFVTTNKRTKARRIALQAAKQQIEIAMAQSRSANAEKNTATKKMNTAKQAATKTQDAARASQTINVTKPAVTVILAAGSPAIPKLNLADMRQKMDATNSEFSSTYGTKNSVNLEEAEEEEAEEEESEDQAKIALIIERLQNNPQPKDIRLLQASLSPNKDIAAEQTRLTTERDAIIASQQKQESQASPDTKPIPLTINPLNKALLIASIPTTIIALMQTRNYIDTTNGPERWKIATQKTKDQARAPFTWTLDKLQHESYVEKSKGLVVVAVGLIAATEIGYWVLGYGSPVKKGYDFVTSLVNNKA